MANTKKPDEKNQLARGISAVALPPGPAVTLVPDRKTLTEDDGTVKLRATVTRVPAQDSQNVPIAKVDFEWRVDDGTVTTLQTLGVDASGVDRKAIAENSWSTRNLPAGSYDATVTVVSQTTERDSIGVQTASISIVARRVQASVTLQRSAAGPTNDQAFMGRDP
jgi:hypothetical protein